MNSIINEEILKITKTEAFRKNPCCYLYNLEDITMKINGIEKNIPNNFEVYYAMKANPNNDIVKYIQTHSRINGVEIASLGELNKALQIFMPSQIIFTGPGKTPQELEIAIKNKIAYIIIESKTEAVRINTIASELGHKQDALLRVNIDYLYNTAHTQMSGYSSKLGIDESQLVETINFCKKLDHVKIMGLHVFAGSGILDSDIISDYAKYIFNMVQKIEANYCPIYCVDIGGGLGINYSANNDILDIGALGKKFRDLTNRYNFQDKKIFLELGRYLVGESGYYITEILDIKESKNKKHIITAGGINHQRRPCAVEYNHPVEILSMHTPKLYPDQISVNSDIVNIGGPLCLNDDILAKDIYVKNANIGDLVIVKQSGAYGFSMAAKDFLSHTLPIEHILLQANMVEDKSKL